MPVAGDVDRKQLWGRSGSRCAICNVDLTELDGLDAIVGDEAHIRSPQHGGPRHDTAYPPPLVDRYANLILLCKAHHKLVDDNCDVFPADLLENVKTSHEARVRRSLNQNDSDWIEHPVLRHLENGTELADVIMGASAYFMDNDHPRDDDEASLISGLLQEAQDWGDIADDVGVTGRVQAAMRMHTQMEDLASHGYMIFGGRGRYRIQPNFIVPTAVIRVKRDVRGSP
jgi:hypothetical protein